MNRRFSNSVLRLSFAFILLTGWAGLWKWKYGNAATDSPAASVGPMISSAERRLRAAEKKLQRMPKDSEAYAEIAAAYMEKARETGDGAFYGRAEAACRKSLELTPDNYAALRLVSWIYSGQHRFHEALAAAQQALERDRRDPLNYGTMGDALLELGDYEKGAKAIQKMVDLRPDVSSYTRAAYVRELFGDLHGAIEIMGMAVRAASSRDREHNAWCRVQLGHLLFTAGRLSEAEAQYQAALQLFPNYHFALTGLGRVRTAQQRFDEAIRFFQTSLDLVPTHEAVFALADLYVHLNRLTEAARQFDLVETIEKINQANGVKSEAQLAMFYADHGVKLREALEIVRQQARERRDVRTMDALAWVLFKNGLAHEALQASQQALRLGTKDPLMTYHYGMIARELGHYKQAKQLLEQALSANPHFHPIHAELASQALLPLQATLTKSQTSSTVLN